MNPTLDHATSQSPIPAVKQTNVSEGVNLKDSNPHDLTDMSVEDGWSEMCGCGLSSNHTDGFIDGVETSPIN